MRQGNRWLRRVLLQAAWAATRAKDGYLAAQFRRLAKRRGDKRAIIAVAHSILTIVYHLLKDGTLYEDLGAAYFDQLKPEKRAQYHLRRLAELGYEVSSSPSRRPDAGRLSSSGKDGCGVCPDLATRPASAQGDPDV